MEQTASADATDFTAQKLTINNKYNNSDTDIWVRAYKDLPYMDLGIRVHWQEKRSLLKLYFSFTDIQEVKIQCRGATIQKDAATIQ